MEPPKLVTDNAIAYSFEALTFIESLAIEEQEKLAEALVRAYAKSLKLLFDSAISSFVHTSQTVWIGILSNARSTFIVDDFVFTVEICPETFFWRVVKVARGEEALIYERAELP